MSTPVLWHFPVSHFSEKVRWALDFKAVPHQRKALFLDYIPRTWMATRQLRLPILFLEGRAIVDSTAIIAELETSQPTPALYPADPVHRERALGLEEFFDEELGPPLRTLILGEAWERDPRKAIELLASGQPDAPLRLAKAIFPLMRAMYRRRHQINPETRAVSRSKLEAALARLERELGPNGYLVGDTFSVADLSAASLFAPIAGPDTLQYPLDPGLLPDAFRAFQETLSKRDGLEWVRETYRRHRGVSAAR